MGRLLFLDNAKIETLLSDKTHENEQDVLLTLMSLG